MRLLAAIALTVLVGLVAALLVWPTPYTYDRTVQINGRWTPVRTDRLTGQIEPITLGTRIFAREYGRRIAEILATVEVIGLVIIFAAFRKREKGVPRHPYSMVRFLAAISLTVLVGLLAALLVWPTPYSYDRTVINGRWTDVRIDRLTGQIEPIPSQTPIIAREYRKSIAAILATVEAVGLVIVFVAFRKRGEGLPRRPSC